MQLHNDSFFFFVIVKKTIQSKEVLIILNFSFTFSDMCLCLICYHNVIVMCAVFRGGALIEGGWLNLVGETWVGTNDRKMSILKNIRFF